MLRQTWLTLAVALMATLVGSGNARVASEPAAPTTPVLELSKEKWHEDLEYFARELPQRHANAFHHVSRERFAAEVAELDGRLGRLNGDEVYFALDRIANLIGDGHTYVQFPPDRANLPLNLERFGEEYRVTHVT